MNRFKFFKGGKKQIKLLLPVLVALVIGGALLGCLIHNSRLTAVTMRLYRMVGIVNFYDENGAEKSIQEKMRLTSGQSISTGEESLVMVSLDDTKLITMEQDSRADIRAKGKALKFELQEGNLFFNVIEKLEDEESFEIETSTMIIGIRGTSAYVGKDKKGHEVLMVTDGTVHMLAENPVTKEQTQMDVPAGQMITVYLDEEAEGDATISVRMQSFKEEDLPALALDTIIKSKELSQRISKATGFSPEKIEALAEVSSVKDVSMFGEAAEELSDAGIEDAVPLMGDSEIVMVNVANSAVDIAKNDLPLEIEIITGMRDILDVGNDAGYEDEELFGLVDAATDCIASVCDEAEKFGVSEEELIDVVDAVSDTLQTTTSEMIATNLSEEEIERVIETISDIYTDSIAEASKNGNDPTAVLLAIAEQSDRIKETVSMEMEKEANGEETVVALLGDTGKKPVVARQRGKTSIPTNQQTTVSTTVTPVATEVPSTTESDTPTIPNTPTTPETPTESETPTTPETPTEPETPTPTEPVPSTDSTKQYTVRFVDENGTTELDVQSVKEGKNPKYLGTSPTKEQTAQYSYTWSGWTNGNQTYGKTETLPAVTGDVTYTATFEPTPRSYRVELNPQGGTISSADVTTYTYGVGATLPTNVTKEATAQYTYRFAGWYTEETGGTKVTSIGTTETGDKQYFAHWNATLNTYSITAASATNGSVTVKVGNATITEAKVGVTVSVTVTPNANYKLKTLTVKDVNDTVITHTPDTDAEVTEYTFTMPANAVTVSAEFEENATGVTGVRINEELDSASATIYVDDEYELVASILPEDADNKNVTWTSSRPSVASVTQDTTNGLIATATGLSVGTTTITVTTEDGGKTATFTITVVANGSPNTTTSTMMVNDTNTEGKSFKKFLSTDMGELYGYGDDYDLLPIMVSFSKSSAAPSAGQMNYNIASDDSDKPVYLWYEENTKAVKWYSEATTVYLDENLIAMFCMDNYYDEDTALTTVDFSGLDMSRVKNIARMFRWCKSLTSVTWGSGDRAVIDTDVWFGSDIANASDLFYGCWSIQVVDLTAFDLSHCSLFDEMFTNCESLTTIYVDDEVGINPSIVSHIFDVFDGCVSLVGGNGTMYDENHIDVTYAYIDKPNQPGYFTEKITSGSTGHNITAAGTLLANMTFYVDENAITTAESGDRVEIHIPQSAFDEDELLTSLTVASTGGSVMPHLDFTMFPGSNSNYSGTEYIYWFTMPDADVTVTAEKDNPTGALSDYVSFNMPYGYNGAYADAEIKVMMGSTDTYPSLINGGYNTVDASLGYDFQIGSYALRFGTRYDFLIEVPQGCEIAEITERLGHQVSLQFEKLDATHYAGYLAIPEEDWELIMLDIVFDE